MIEDRMNQGSANAQIYESRTQGVKRHPRAVFLRRHHEVRHDLVGRELIEDVDPLKAAGDHRVIGLETLGADDLRARLLKLNDVLEVEWAGGRRGEASHR